MKLILLRIFVVTISLAVSVNAQSGKTSPCKVGVQSPPVGFWSWAPDSRIKVYVINDDFSESELPFLLAPLSTWNAVSHATRANVKFEYKGTTEAPLYCQNCLTIKRDQVFDKSKRHLTKLRTYIPSGNVVMMWATIVIDPLQRNPETLTNAVAHELGHSLGLLDCFSCKQTSTVMIQFKNVNTRNGMDGPTACDVAQVKMSYQALAARLKQQSVQARKAPTEEGEEPVEDDTPIVIPKP